MSSVSSVVATVLIVAPWLVLFVRSPPLWAPSYNRSSVALQPLSDMCKTKASPCQGSELPVLIPQAEAEDLTSENKSSISTV